MLDKELGHEVPTSQMKHNADYKEADQKINASYRLEGTVLGIEDLDLILKERRLRWYGHVERSNGAVKTAFDIQVNGKRGPGRPKMTWKQLTERDRREWKLSAIDPHDRVTWRSGVRSAMRAASQLPGRGPTVVDMAPIPAR